MLRLVLFTNSMSKYTDNSGKMTSEDLKDTMKLYTYMDRIQNELQERGWNAGPGTTVASDALLTPEQLSEIDSLHYLGNDAIRQAIEQAIIRDTHVVGDLGSGLGGPARMLSHWTGCRVTAVELQPDLHAVAQALTTRCGLTTRVKHVCGNILEASKLLPDASFDILVSWLVFLHIADRSTLFAQCRLLLKPSGKLYVEDFVQLAPLTARETHLLQTEVAAPCLPTLGQLQNDLATAGLQMTWQQDMTAAWKDYVHERRNAYRADLARHERVHGPTGAANLLVFYNAVDELFQGGHVGGIAYVAESVYSYKNLE